MNRYKIYLVKNDGTFFRHLDSKNEFKKIFLLPPFSNLKSNRGQTKKSVAHFLRGIGALPKNFLLVSLNFFKPCG